MSLVGSKEAAVLDDASEFVCLEGYVAGYAAQSLTANPYGGAPEAAVDWVKGWLQAHVDVLHERRRARHGPGEDADELRPE